MFGGVHCIGHRGAIRIGKQGVAVDGSRSDRTGCLDFELCRLFVGGVRREEYLRYAAQDDESAADELKGGEHFPEQEQSEQRCHDRLLIGYCRKLAGFQHFRCVGEEMKRDEPGYEGGDDPDDPRSGVHGEDAPVRCHDLAGCIDLLNAVNLHRVFQASRKQAVDRHEAEYGDEREQEVPP